MIDDDDEDWRRGVRFGFILGVLFSCVLSSVALVWWRWVNTP